MNTNEGLSQPLLKVLLVDDELALLKMLERFLTGGGYSVVTAASGTEGFRAFQESAVDIVIVDRAMPGMSGEVLAREIKSRAPNLPIILITGFVGMVTSPELFHSIVAKPFHPLELVRRVTEALESTPRGEMRELVSKAS